MHQGHANASATVHQPSCQLPPATCQALVPSTAFSQQPIIQLFLLLSRALRQQLPLLLLAPAHDDRPDAHAAIHPTPLLHLCCTFLLLGPSPFVPYLLHVLYISNPKKKKKGWPRGCLKRIEKRVERLGAKGSILSGQKEKKKLVTLAIFFGRQQDGAR